MFTGVVALGRVVVVPTITPPSTVIVGATARTRGKRNSEAAVAQSTFMVAVQKKSRSN